MDPHSGPRVLQGSVLDPHLFAIVMGGLEKSLNMELQSLLMIEVIQNTKCNGQLSRISESDSVKVFVKLCNKIAGESQCR